ITVDGGAQHADGAGSAALHPLGEVVSPPLVDVLAYLVQRSDNHLADAVFRTIGAAGGDATWAGAARHATDALARLGVDTAGFALADGSGLSRLGRATPRALVDLDELMTRSPFAAAWSSFYAVAGSSGTLRSRLAGTPAAGVVAGKTGSLRDVRALAGYVTDGSRVRFRFSVVGNDLDRPGLDAVERAQDEIAVALAERALACAGMAECPAVGP
ncbi:MAG TPA: D-alanyl-D-alanine carboxypeptidase/D-alanyl-D-alanine-endopeptidase, partial [Acidimicrobiales bacterium]|nr:D-alanyl-D-alanine carboxypeptidase/D-alanyl-D-alanine-endopeptidase [Acidimicrobiales bacterium]